MIVRRLLALWLLLLILLTACTSPDGDDPIPTLVSLDDYPTAQFLTQNAPPAGFGLVQFDPIDSYLTSHQGWTYLMTGSFEGTFVESGDPATGTFEAQIWSNELGESRRAVLEVEGTALSPDETLLRLEGVRISNDYYIVDANGQCSTGAEQTSVIADLSAGQVIGGVKNAVPTGHRQEIEGVPVWQYTFSPDDMRLPAIRRNADSEVALGADLWISPDYNAVLRYDVQLTVENVTLLWGERAVSGDLTLHYELVIPELDVQPNISVPHGC
jgi:hypothetical protein